MALGVDRIEGKGRFAAATDTGDDHQFFTGDLEIDAFEIVFAGPDDFDPTFVFRCRCILRFGAGHGRLKKDVKVRNLGLVPEGLDCYFFSGKK